MDFDYDDDQRMLADSLSRLLRDRYDFEARTRYAKTPPGFSEAMWAAYAELGLLAAPFPVDDGGLGMGAVETLIVMEALGGALALEPYLATVLLAGGLIRHAADADQKARLIPRIAAGALRLAFAHEEREAGGEVGFVETRARRDGEAYVIHGEKSLVSHGDSADLLIVSARTAGGAEDEAGISLFLVDPAASGVSRRGYPTQDGLRAAEISLTDVRVDAADRLGADGGAGPIIARIVDEAIAALCAEAVGVMAKAQALTVEYLKTRQQFGAPIGSFQVLQHRAADMAIALEQARSMAFYAAMMVDAEDPGERRRAIHAAKVQIGRSARTVGQGAVQLHGGVGVTNEYSVAHAFKRLTMIDLAFGDADHHLVKLAAAGGLELT